MSSEGTDKTSNTYLGAHIRWKKSLCAYWDSVGRGDVTDMDMRFHMKFSAEKLGYPSRNIPLDSIDTHLNQAGGACAMKLAGFDDVVKCFLGIHSTETIGVLSMYGNQNDQD